MTRFTGIIFDLDDTLYSRRAAFGHWLDAYLHGTLRLTDAAEIAQIQSEIHALDRNGYGSKQAIFERLHALYPTLPGEAARSLETFFVEFLAHITPEPRNRSPAGRSGRCQNPVRRHHQRLGASVAQD